MRHLRSALVTASLLALVSACSGGEPENTPGTCDDGVRNGTETGVDCGGSCRVKCALGDACASNADCMWSSCAASVCAVPPNAPKASGAQSIVLGKAGGTIDVTTPEGVNFHLDVPAGALAGDLPIKVEPVTAHRGEYFSIAFDTPGLAFRTPASLTITLPEGATFDADTVFYARASEADQRFYGPSMLSADRRTLTAQVSMLGFSSRANDTNRTKELPGADERYWTRFFANASSLPTDQLISVMRTLIHGLADEGLYQEAAAVGLGVQMVLQRIGEDEGAWSAAAHEFFDELMRAICVGLQAATDRANAAEPHCMWQARDLLSDVLALGKLEEQVNLAVNGTCSSSPDWNSAASTLIGKAVAFMDAQTNRVAVVDCNCNDPKYKKALAENRVRERLECRGRTRGMSAKAGDYDHATPADDWLVLLDSVDDTADAFAPLYAMGAVENTQRFDRDLGGGVVESVRKHAFTLCLDNQDSSILNALGERVSRLDAPRSEAASAIFADAQHCGAALHLVSQKENRTEQSHQDVPFPTTPGAAPNANPIKADSDGWLQISGPIATLRCRDAASFATANPEADVLTFTSVGNGRRHTIDTRQANRAQHVLEAAALPFPVDIHAQLVALGLPTDQPASFDVVIERAGPGCGVQPASTTLFSIPVKVGEPRIVFANTGMNGTLDIFTVDADGSNLFNVTKGAFYDANNPIWSHDHKRIAFSFSDSQTPDKSLGVINADGTGGRSLITLGVSYWILPAAWSSDDRTIYASEGQTGGYRGLRALDAGGGGSQLTRNMIPQGYCDGIVGPVSRDGTRVLVYASKQPTGDCYKEDPPIRGTFILSASGATLGTLPTPAQCTAISLPAAWSPDGTKLIMTCGGVSNGSYVSSWIELMADGSGATPIIVPAPPGYPDMYAVWYSYDGSQFMGTPGYGPFPVYLWDRDGSNFHQLLPAASAPDW